jgi:uncharacterized protein (DUF3084 family)
MKKISFLVVVILFLGLTSAYSPPKIVEITDSFGNTYQFEPGEEETYVSSFNDREEVVLTNETEITLCVTEYKAEDGREVKFSMTYPTGGSPGSWSEDNCKSFSLDENDYGTNLPFYIWIKDDSDIEYHCCGADFYAQIRYTNIALESDKDLETYSFDQITINKGEYEDMNTKIENLENSLDEEQEENKEASDLEENLAAKEATIQRLQQGIDEKNSTIEELRGELDGRDSEIDELNQDIDQKESTIQDLNDEVENKNSKIDEKNSKINEMNSTITELRSKVEELKGGFLNKLGNLF